MAVAKARAFLRHMAQPVDAALLRQMLLSKEAVDERNRLLADAGGGIAKAVDGVVYDFSNAAVQGPEEAVPPGPGAAAGAAAGSSSAAAGAGAVGSAGASAGMSAAGEPAPKRMRVES